MPIVYAYAAYIALAFGVTVRVGLTLFRGGRVFLVDAFRGNTELADSVNRLLVAGFYLVSTGFIMLGLSTTGMVTNGRLAIEFVADKLGLAMLVLGGMHFANLFVLNRLRQRGRERGGGAPSGAWAPGDAPLGRVLE
jgi:hypothetical protein